MFGKIWRQLRAIPSLLYALSVLRADVSASLQNEAMGAAWEKFLSDPAISPSVPRFSDEWRTLEEAIRRLE